MYLPCQLERIEQNVVRDGTYGERGWGGHAPPPSPACADFFIRMEGTPESVRCHSMYSVCNTVHIRGPRKNFLIFLRPANRLLPRQKIILEPEQWTNRNQAFIK